MKKRWFILMLPLALLLFSEMKTEAAEAAEIFEYTPEELRRGVQIGEKRFVADNEHRIVDNIVTGKDSFLLLGRSDKRENLYETSFCRHLPYLEFYRNNSLQWVYEDTGVHGIFAGGVILDDTIVAAGIYEKENGFCQLTVLEFDFNGNLCRQFQTAGNNDTHMENIYYLSNGFYITGTTKATDLDNSHLGGEAQIFVMSLNRELELDNIAFFGNDGDSSLYASGFDGTLIYLYGRLTGEGFFNTGPGLERDMIITVEEHLDLCMDKPISEKKELMIASPKYLALGNYEENGLQWELYDGALNMVGTKSVTLHQLVFNVVGCSRSFGSPGNKIIFCETLENNGRYYDKIFSFDENMNILSETEIEKETDAVTEYCFDDDNIIYLFDKNDEGKVTARSVVDVRMMNGECFFNGERGTKTEKPLPSDVFGDYLRETEFSFGNIVIKTFFPERILPRVSIVDRGLYDLNVVLTFNGEGFLNGERIENNYKITERGNYILEVKGKDESVYYTFRVGELAVNEPGLPVVSVIPPVLEERKTAFTTRENTNLNLMIEEITQIEEKSLLIPFLFSLTGIFPALLIPLRDRNRDRYPNRRRR